MSPQSETKRQPKTLRIELKRTNLEKKAGRQSLHDLLEAALRCAYGDALMSPRVRTHLCREAIREVCKAIIRSGRVQWPLVVHLGPRNGPFKASVN